MWRSAVVAGLVVAAVNILFTGLEYGFGNLPLWFYAMQLLLLPAMLLPLHFFPLAGQTQNFLHRMALFAQGWAVPYAIYRLSADAMSLTFSPLGSFISYLVMLLMLSALFAVLRTPKKKM